MAIKHQNHSFLLDALYCEEQVEIVVEEEEQEYLEEEGDTNINNEKNPSLFLLEQDMFWEDEELLSLFSKEQETHNLNLLHTPNTNDTESRKEAVEWILRVNTHFDFTPLTAILAINYLDRFLSSFQFQRDKPWMIQLTAVTCLSLAAKVEETQVPLLLDLQVEGTKYVFEAKTIQRMELLVLSTLQWRMNPVTPVSFFDHVIRRLGLKKKKTHLNWEFLRRCERLLLSAIAADPRFVGFLPSVLATATMLHVIHQVEPSNSTEYENQLLGVLKLSKEKVKDCYQLIEELSNATTSTCFSSQQSIINPPPPHHHKRKYQQHISSSPSGVVDASFSSSDSSNDSWAVQPTPLFKKNRVFVQLVATSR